MGLVPGDIISHSEMCKEENGIHLTKGMNFRVKGGATVVLMSLRKGAPYADKLDEGGEVLVYEGHDVPKNLTRDPKAVDQPKFTPSGSLTENGKFYEAAVGFKKGKNPPELVKVYEKIKDGIWAYNGVFELVDSWTEFTGERNVFKFKLIISNKSIDQKEVRSKDQGDLIHNRLIPTSVKLEVWKRDKGRCVTCGSTNNLHYDHILPFSKGGTSLKAENIQLLCARHNLSKHDKIQ